LIKSRYLIYLIVVFLLSIVGGCGDKTSAKSNYNPTVTQDKIEKDLKELTSATNDVIDYELSKDNHTLTLYVTDAMKVGTYQQKKDLLNKMAEYFSLTIREFDQSAVNVYVKSNSSKQLLYYYEGGLIGVK